MSDNFEDIIANMRENSGSPEPLQIADITETKKDRNARKVVARHYIEDHEERKLLNAGSIYEKSFKD